MSFTEYCTESEKQNGCESVGYSRLWSHGCWELGLCILPAITRVSDLTLLAWEQIRIQNLKYSCSWMHIAFAVW